MQNRAHIFQAFDALSGYRELLEKQETIEVPKRYLSQEDYEILDSTIKEVEIGSNVRVIYYDNGKYFEKIGRVSKLNYDTRIIQVVKTKIDFKKLYEIEIVKWLL